MHPIFKSQPLEATCQETGQPDPSDAELLRRMALRDQGAFDLFYRRHEKLLFGLALYIVRDRSEAEEALQEAMTRIWLSAGNFQANGNARGWVTRIVARFCLQRKRRSKLSTQPLSELTLEELTTPEEGPAIQCDKTEILALVRRLLLDLAAEDQHLVVLHFGTGLSQNEIGRYLTIPQTTVCRRLARILSLLQSRIQESGCVGGGLLQIEGLLREAIPLRVQPPAALGVRIRSGIAERCRSPAGRSVPLHTLWLGSALAGVVLGGWWLTAESGVGVTVPFAVHERSASGTGTLFAAQGPQAAGIQRTRLQAHWSFEQGIPEALRPQQGSWLRWEPPGKGVAAAAVAPLELQHGVFIEIPVDLPPVPLVVRARVRLPNLATRLGPGVPRSTPFKIQVLWANRDAHPVAFEFQANRTQFLTEAGRPYLTEIFVYKRWILSKIREAGHPAYFCEYQNAYPKRRLEFCISGLELEDLAVEELEESQLPALLKNPQGLWGLVSADPSRWYRPPRILVP